MENIRILLTGGGTGGHVYPNVALFEELKDKYPGSEFLYLGTRRGNESKILESLSLPITFKPIQARGLPANIRSISALPALWRILVGTIQSYFIIRRWKPHLVIGTGGYVSAPVVLAAAIQKKKIFLHEQNSIPGRMNRLMSRFASIIGISFESTKKYFPADKCVFTGYPLRHSLYTQDRELLKKKFSIPIQNRVVFIFSGSTGSRSINQAAVEIIPQLLQEKDLTVIISTGKSYTSRYKAYDETVKALAGIGIPTEIEGKLILKEYFTNIEEIYAVSDLVVARAGAGSIKEIASLALPMILIPKIDLPGDHQIMNAREVEQQGGAVVITEEVQLENGMPVIRVPEVELQKTIKRLTASEEERQRLHQNLLHVKKVDSLKVMAAEVDKLLQKDRLPETVEVGVYYLHSPQGEKNYELLFDSTTFGNTMMADHFLEEAANDLLFEIKSIHHQGKESLSIRRIRGELQVGDQAVMRWCELSVGDHIRSANREWVVSRYVEKVKTGRILPRPGEPPRPIFTGILARVGGFLREIVIAAAYGASRVVDLFSVALSIVRLFRRIFSEETLDQAFVPFFRRLLYRGPKKQAWKSVSPLLTITLLAALIVVPILMLLAPAIIRLLFPGLVAKDLLPQAVHMMRLMALSLVLTTLASILAVISKTLNRVRVAEASAMLVPIGVITGIFLFHARFYSLAYGVLLGVTLQLALLLPLCIRLLAHPSLEFSYLPTIKLKGSAGKKFLTQMSPVTANAAISQVTAIADKHFGAAFPVGTLSYLYFALEIFRLPLALISRAVQAKILGGFSEHTALFHKEKTRRIVIDGIAHSLFLLIPLSILLVMLANPLISLLLQRFRFDATAAANTAWILQFYALGLAGWGIHNLTGRFFLARQEKGISIALNFTMMLLHIGLCLVLVQTRLRFAGIALASTLSTTLFALIRVQVLKGRLAQEQMVITGRDLLAPLFKTLLAALFMISGILEGSMIFQYIRISSPFIQNLIRLVSLSFLGVAIYILSSLIMKNSGVLIFRRGTAQKPLQTPIPMLGPVAFMEWAQKKPEAHREEYRYKIPLYLSSPKWEIRNIGTKLIGLFHADAYAPYLLDLLQSRQETHFIRRNAVVSLRALHLWNTEIRSLALQLLADPYYEIRVAALALLGDNMPEEEYSVFRDDVAQRIRRGRWEERLVALKWLAKHGTKEDLSLASSLYLDANSLIREELLELLVQFYRRKILNKEELKEQLQCVLITSNHLVADFKIKSILQRIHKEIKVS